MKDHSIVKEIKRKTKVIETITQELMDKKISSKEADAIAKLHNSDANTYNSLIRMATFNIKHHPKKAKPYFNFD